MYIAFNCLVFLVSMVIQTSVCRYVTIAGVRPDVVLVIVVYLALVKGADVGCLSGFFFGLFQDAYSGVFIGTNALTKTFLGFLCGMLGKRLYTQSVLSHMLCVGIGTVMQKFLFLSFYGLTPGWKPILFYETLYNLLCCPFIFAVYRFGERYARSTPSS